MFSPTGNIKDLTIPWLFQDLCKGRRTGTAIFEQGAAIMKVFFKQGDIIFASSNIDDDTMGEFLLRTGKITQDQRNKSSEIIHKTGKKLGAVLFELGALTPQDLVAQVKFQVKQNILNLLRWGRGRYRFEDGLLPGAEIVPLHMSTVSLILEGVRDLDWQEIRKSLPPLNTVIRRVANPAALFQSSHLDPGERTVLSLMSDNSSIQDICGLSNLGDLKTLSSTYILLALRMAVTGEIKEQKEKEFTFQAERETFAAEESKQPDPTAEALVTREMLQNAYDSLDMQDYYEMLGVGHGATPQDIKKAYLHLAKLYHPDRHADPRLGDMKQKLEKLFVGINDAYNILSVKEKRDQYNLDLASGTRKYGKEELKTAEKAEKQDNGKVSATVQFNEGMKQFRVQNFWGAEEAFRWAVRLDPSNPEYVYYQGLALAHMPRRRHEAEEYFIKAVSMAPSHTEYSLELGNFYVKNGLKTKAVAVYQDALKRDPKSDKMRLAIKNAGG